MQNVSQVLTHGRTELAKVIVGQEELINQCLLTVLCGGHALLEGVPGIAKTLVIKSFARLFTLEFRRVQCTSDLMPADIIGSNVLILPPVRLPCTADRSSPIFYWRTKS